MDFIPNGNEHTAWHLRWGDGNLIRHINRGHIAGHESLGDDLLRRDLIADFYQDITRNG